MFIACIIFWAGRRYYRIVPSSGEFIPAKFVKAYFLGFANRKNMPAKYAEDPETQHYVFAAPGYSTSFLKDCRRQGAILFVLLPVVLFWALFDQQDTTWTDQVLKMNQWVTIGGKSFRILPEQISVLNPILVMMIIPFCYKFLFPFIERFNVELRPLKRVLIGMVLAGISFGMMGLLQIYVDAGADAWEYSADDKTMVCRDNNSDPRCPHVLWQLLPYIVITFSEVFLSIAGLEFAYSEAPKEMKSTSSSFWLLCVSMGNLLFLIVSNIPVSESFGLKGSFFLFGALMVLDSALFLYMSKGYKYASPYIPASQSGH